MKEAMRVALSLSRKMGVVKLFALVLFLAAFLRLYRLGSIPLSPYWEETALGYDAYSISKTGKDFHGNSYPIIAFPSFGDYKPSGYFYAIVPFVRLLGLNVWAVRLPSAIAGIATVWLMFLIGRELFDIRVGIASSLVAAVNPWLLQFSRGGWEVNLALSCAVAGSYFLLRARKNVWSLPLAVLFFDYSIYTYHAARIFSPLWGGVCAIALLFFWVRNKLLSRNRFLVTALSFGLALGAVAPLLINIRSTSVSSRFDATSIFSDPAPVLASNAQIELHGNTRLSRIVYHRYWFYGGAILQNYLKHFSPEFLFIRGDGNLRHGTVAFGLLYIWDGIFILVAIVALFVRRDWRFLFIAFSIALAGVAPSLVSPTPHALRFLFAAPGFVLLSAYGIVKVLSDRRLRSLPVVQTGVVILYFVTSVLYMRYYFSKYPIKSAADWQYGYKEMLSAVSRERKVGEPVFITREQGRPSMYYLFYSGYDPTALQRVEPKLPKDQLELLQVGDYHFVDALPTGNGVFASSPEKRDEKSTLLDTIKRPDGSIVWVIWRR